MIVVDASAMLELLLNSEAAAGIRRYVFAVGESMHVPHLIDLEVLQVLRKYTLSKVLNPARARECLEDYAGLPLVRYPHDLLLSRIWELRHNLTAYDAIYLALAEALEAPLITCDRALGSATGHRARVVVY